MILYLNTQTGYADVMDFRGQIDVDIANALFQDLIRNPKTQEPSEGFDEALKKKDKAINDLLELLHNSKEK